MKLSFKYRIGTFIINLISKTWRINLTDELPPKPSVVVFWHGLMLPGWKVFENSNPTAIISLSKDGEILSELLKKWGVSLIRGSSSRAGSEALDEMIRVAKNNILLVTPDGPRGPIFKFKAGALISSIRTGSPLYLTKILIKHKITFNRSWDKFEFPLPFSKIYIGFDGPYLYSNDINRDETSIELLKLEQQLVKFNEIHT